MIDTITQGNLYLSCRMKNTAEVRPMIGADFKSRGDVSEDCVAFLAERERQNFTFLGNGITLPHLPESATSIIVTTGVEIYQFPDGMIRDRNNVISIAMLIKRIF
jgi:mannitol/fructose-specific phosphotransferase system IIA component